jgi:hypothetical protein
MKQLIFSLSTSALLIVALFSCSKITELNKHDDNAQKISAKSIDENEILAARIVIGRGRSPKYINGFKEVCTGTYKCGPCPGACLKVVKTSKRGPLTSGKFDNEILNEVFPPFYSNDELDGDITGIATLEEKGTKIRVLLEGDGVDEGNGFSTFPNSVIVNEETTALLGRKQIIILKGEYKIDYSRGGFGEVVYDVVSK